MTSPVGIKDQNWFVNGVAALSVEITPQELLEGLLAIERGAGRVRKERWGPRLIDLDILFFGQQVIRSADLRVPHPRMHQRKFVLVPMVQLAPDLVHPTLGVTMAELLDNVRDADQVVSPIEA
jgi:2-amino-4-hydroxy-6-hydroxymethyldihydropteridine diphosphokinase